MTSIEPEDVPHLPQLEPGITLLTTDGRATGALQSLVLDHLLLSNGEAVWVDARGNAATTSLLDIAPSRRTLDRIQVARAFTAFQHYSLLETLPEIVTDDTSLLVAPAIEHFYGADDLSAGEGETMLEAGLEILADVAGANDIPVLVSRTTSATLGGTVEPYADLTLEYEQTQFGPRFRGEGFETLVFECPGGVQTTLAFWRRVLQQRHAAVRTHSQEVYSHGAN